jgi:hypothetical protein
MAALPTSEPTNTIPARSAGAEAEGVETDKPYGVGLVVGADVGFHRGDVGLCDTGLLQTPMRWVPDDNVNMRYERLIGAWVKVAKTFPDMKTDSLAQDAHQRVAYKWERLARASGYAGKKHQQKVEQGS